MFIRRTCCILFIFVLLLVGVGPVQAQPGTQQSVLLVLSTPEFSPDPKNSQDLEQLVTDTARPLLNQLEGMRAAGQISGYHLIPANNTILVKFDPSALPLSDLRALPGVAATRDPAKSAPTCQEVDFTQLKSFSKNLSKFSTASALPTATNPSVQVWISAYGYSVYGYTDPNLPVTLVVKNSAGQEKLRSTSSSYSDGWYYFYMGSTACGSSNNTMVSPGDLVEVNAKGTTVQVVIVPVGGLINGAADTISGVTAPNRAVNIYLYNLSASSPCTTSTAQFNTTSDASGAFTLGGIGALDNSTDGAIYILDANGNIVSTALTNYYLNVGQYGYFNGQLPPRSMYAATLKRGDTTLQTVNGQAQIDGSYSGYFWQDPTAGDVITLTGGGVNLSVTFVQVTNMAFDVVNNTVTGQAGAPYAGYVVYFTPSRQNVFTCTGEGGCAKGVVAADGSFTLNTGTFDLKPGDYDSSPILYDLQGNRIEFRSSLYVPYLYYNVNEGYLQGYWSNTGIPITVTVKDSLGAVKNTLTGTTSSGDASFYIYPSAVTGDRLEASDGITTLFINSIPPMSAFLDSITNNVHGTAPDGSARVNFRDRRYSVNPDGYDYHYGSSSSSSTYCWDTTVASGAYTVNAPSGIDINGPDSANVYSTVNDGNLVGSFSHAFNLLVQKGNTKVDGYLPKGNAAFTAELWRGGALIDTQAGSSDTYSHFNFNFTGPMQDGDLLKLDAPDVVMGEVTLPTLTMQQDNATGVVSGMGPVNTPLTINAFQPEPNFDYYYRTVNTDAAGNYSVTISNWFDDYCRPLSLQGCSRPEVIYQVHDFLTYFVTGVIPPVTADSFENDNEFGSASTYTGIQDHTFHTSNDVDWVKVEVTEQDLGKTFFLTTTNLGVNASTDLYLYDSTGLTEIMSETGYTPKTSILTWMPETAGTYYVKIVPYSSSNTIECGSTYSFFIAHNQTFLPMIMK